MNEPFFRVLWQCSRAERTELARLGCPTLVPWGFVAPHERQAQTNHSQSLARLNERGGLSPAELVAVLEDRRLRFHAETDVDAVPRLLQLLGDYQARHPPG